MPANDVLDPDTRRTLAGGRQTIGDAVAALQAHGRRLFVVFVIGLLGTIYAMRAWIWPILKADLLARGASVVAITPFDIILLQAKLGIIVGILLGVPLLIYYTWGPLQHRGWWPTEHVAKWKLGLLALAVPGFAMVGIVYAYYIIFPFLFDFLARNAIQAGLKPTYSIVYWTQFIVYLSLSFALAAQLPLVMFGLTYADIVSYRTFRNRWKHAVLAMVIVGAMINGTPEPFSMTLVAAPMIVLYGVGLACSRVITTAIGREGPEMGEPKDLDLADLDAEGVRAAPPEAFAALSEGAVLTLARAAIDADEPEKAEAILDRYDEADEPTAIGDVEEEAPDPEADSRRTEAGPHERATGEVEGGFLTRRVAGVMDAFTEEETTEEGIGGYAYDIAFVLDSLTSKGFRIFAVFGTVLVSVFFILYSGGIGAIKRDFLRRLPAVVRPEEINVITLHPVEALIFEVKIATLLGAVATLPMILYYAWPALEERGFASGNRNVFFGWAAALFGGLTVGSAIGYYYVAPAVISYFVWDAYQANMIVAYRVLNFAWLVFFTTVGIGLLADVPVTMLLFHRGGIVSYRTMRERWRIVTLGVMTFAAVFTPASVLSMVLVAFPVMFAYFVGLAILWMYTFGGRRVPHQLGESPEN